MSPATDRNFQQQAQEALEELDSSKADELFVNLIVSLEDAFNKNQKDVAAELQQIAKSIESGGKIDDSLRFKQRTCEIMLRRSMAERRKNQPPPAPPREAKVVTQMAFVSFSPDPPSYAAFFNKLEVSSELRVLPDGSRWLRSSQSQLMLISKQHRLSGSYSMFIAPSREDASRYFQEQGYYLDGDELDICGKKVLVFKDKVGQRFLVAGAEIVQNM